MNETKKIIIVSDGTGGTAQRLMDAVLVQYGQTDVIYSLEQTYPQTRSHEDIGRILGEIGNDYLVLYSIISLDLSNYFSQQLEVRAISHLNVLQPMLETVSKFLGVHPKYQPGLLQIIDDLYYREIDAIRYTVAHDDGGGAQIDQADTVLLGLSRSCKTPISVYLACNHGLQVANIPVIRDPGMTETMLERIESVDPKKIIGLLMNPETLLHIREERSSRTGGALAGPLKDYLNLDEVTMEFRFCRDLYRSKGWPVVNVTHRAIEEVSKEILRLLGRPAPRLA